MTDAELLHLLAAPDDSFARGLVELGWFQYRPTLTTHVYRANARAALQPEFRSAGQVDSTGATALRLTLQEGGWQDAVAIFESLLRRSPQFAVCFCKIGTSGLLVMTVSDPAKSGLKSADISAARVYLDIKHPGNYEHEILRKLRELPRDSFAKALQEAISVEKVTRKFYDEYKKRMEVFSLSITPGISDADRKWYASVLLNRLMYIYFIQAGGLLPEPDYLMRHLRSSDGHYYQNFLLPLFFDGLGQPEPRSDEVTGKIGKVPYLDGGLFQKHELEKNHPGMDIPDSAFQEILGFFDSYTWHIDDRPMRSDRQINPDVLGYIFEKYVNQKQMGAYYTKEDITEYISKNTIIPFLFDRVLEACPIGSAEWQPWELLKQWPEDYIYPAVKKGVLDEEGEPLREELLPDWVRKDMAEPRARMYDKRYNLGAAEFVDAEGRAYHLPTETWREYAERRARCLENYGKMQRGEVHDINDLITLNLDIRRFAEDAIVMCDDPHALLAWYEALSNVSVLDPTCGSGAFLFAAVNVLEPLYRACLTQMEKLRGRLKEFGPVLEEVKSHPSRRYFVLKTIILNNLYGVDIEEEAVEICKLRLFLKLAGHAEPDPDKPNYGVEPLPDIDFNIRAGNTLVGYATEEQARTAFEAHGGASGRLDFSGEWEKLKTSLTNADATFGAFRTAQSGDADAKTSTLVALTKKAHHDQLELLNEQCYRVLAAEYDVDLDDGESLRAWLASHQPFHWFIEFHEIMSRGGFDVVIGNPPYVAASDVRQRYGILSYAAKACPDIYALCLERATVLLTGAQGRLGMIVPISFQFSASFSTIRHLFEATFCSLWASTYSRNPAALFAAGLGVRSTILFGLSGVRSSSRIHVTRLNRWTEDQRPYLFASLAYTYLPDTLRKFGWPRLDSAGIGTMLERMVSKGGKLGDVLQNGRYELRFKTTSLYYISAFSADPPAFDGTGTPITQTKIGTLPFASPELRERALAVVLSRVALLWWMSTGDDFDVTRVGLSSTPIDLTKLETADVAQLERIAKVLSAEMKRHVIFTRYAGKLMGNYDIKQLRHLTDEVDHIILRAYGLSEHMDDLELAYVRFMKMTGDRPGTIRIDTSDW